MASKVEWVLRSVPKVVSLSLRLDSSRAAFSRVRRTVYPRSYPVALVNPDGSSIVIRYHEPRCVIQLPLDLEKCSEQERKRRLVLRQPRTRVRIAEEVQDAFDLDEYSHLWK